MPDSAPLLSSPVLVASLPSAMLSQAEQQSYNRQQRRPPFPQNGISTMERPFFSQRQGIDNIDNASRLSPRLDQHQEQRQPSRFSYPLGFDLEPTPIREPPMQHQTLLPSSYHRPLQLQNPSLYLQEPPSSQESGSLLGCSINEQQPRIFHDQLLLSHHGHQQGGGLLTGGPGTAHSNNSSLAFSFPILVPGGSLNFAAFQQLRTEGPLQQRQLHE